MMALWKRCELFVPEARIARHDGLLSDPSSLASHALCVET